jgi:KaiC/GvpD/RAD55 family RecA-like ATPase
LKNADNTNIKTTVIVKGGPGTGKSVIALHLLTYFLKQGKISHYATGSKPLLKHFGDVW